MSVSQTVFAWQIKPRGEGSAFHLCLEQINSFTLAQENCGHRLCFVLFCFFLFFLIKRTGMLRSSQRNLESIPWENGPSGRHLVLLLFVIVKSSATGQLDGYKYSAQHWRPLNPAFLEAQWEPTEVREGAVKPSQLASLPLSFSVSILVLSVGVRLEAALRVNLK